MKFFSYFSDEAREQRLNISVARLDGELTAQGSDGFLFLSRTEDRKETRELREIRGARLRAIRDRLRTKAIGRGEVVALTPRV